MAKKTTIKTEEPAKENFFKRISDFFRNNTTTFVSGLLLMAFTLFLGISFISFFMSGGADQDVIDPVSTAVSDVENSGGLGGAVMVSFFVNDCFGWSSVFLLPLLGAISLRMMNIHRPNLVKWFICAMFAILWGSLFFAFTLNDVFVSFMSPGGAHGQVVVDWLKQHIGVGGILLLLVTSFLLFMVYLTRETIEMLRKFFSFSYLRKLKREPADDEKKEVTEDADKADAVVVTKDKVEETVSDEDEQEEGDDADDDDADEESEDDDKGDDEGDASTTELTLSIETAGDDEEEDDDEDDEDEDEESDDEEDDDTEESDDDKLARQFDKIAGAVAPGEVKLDVEEVASDDTGGDMHRPINPRDELSYYKPPTVDLLDKYDNNVAQSIDMVEQNVKKDEIVRVLRNFDIEISSIKATVGPTITLYEITPAPGVRISKIRNLEDDIAMSLSALCIRIIAPIPGKGTIGIEVPNANKQIVPMASLLNSRKFKETDMALPLALGKTISNEVFMVDMAKMPHLLVAGATGMGKSVGLNAIITSLLYKMHPAYLKFVMVDPKMVELSLYSVIEKHFLAKLEGEDEPIITDVTKVVRTLKSLCTEMDNRYRLLQAAMVRSVKEYNAKYLNKELLPTKGHRFMPYIVVIIDEYGDLMMTAGKEVELPIARIAQKARAVGIHMIIATQRPTTNIITGTIKANFPARMAFRVISPIDSRTILERTGANQLQGRGDMLFLAGNDPVRVQCALVETKEVERVCNHISKQQGYASAYILPEPDEAAGEGGTASAMRGGDTQSVGKLDELFVEAARTVVLHQQGSTSLLQRKFNVGFNRAGRIMDQLCKTGIVGEQDGSKPRQVLCSDEADLEFRLKTILQKD